MKKLSLILTIMIVMGCFATSAFAVTNVSSQLNVSLANLLSVEFDSAAANSNFPTGGPVGWASVDPSQDFIRPDGVVTTKADIALIVKSTQAWHASVAFAGAADLNGKVNLFLSQPNLRDPTGTLTNGMVTSDNFGDAVNGWMPVYTASRDIYWSGANDANNIPNGVFMGISLCLRPAGIPTGVALSGGVTYTVTYTI